MEVLLYYVGCALRPTKDPRRGNGLCCVRWRYLKTGSRLITDFQAIYTVQYAIPAFPTPRDVNVTLLRWSQVSRVTSCFKVPMFPLSGFPVRTVPRVLSVEIIQ